MEQIRKELLGTGGVALTKKQYKWAVAVENNRLFQQLIFMTIVSAIVATVLFFSLYFDLKD